MTLVNSRRRCAYGRGTVGRGWCSRRGGIRPGLITFPCGCRWGRHAALMSCCLACTPAQNRRRSLKASRRGLAGQSLRSRTGISAFGAGAAKGSQRGSCVLPAVAWSSSRPTRCGSKRSELRQRNGWTRGVSRRLECLPRMRKPALGGLSLAWKLTYAARLCGSWGASDNPDAASSVAGGSFSWRCVSAAPARSCFISPSTQRQMASRISGWYPTP
ncbi:hypothetical protein SAMN05216359_105317 [Roseateles sp. YR242]|nr:hypothetical protein SAMN05216359_105317 [Roseateles sp. YR242]